jgi:hypothetical protein
VGDLAELLADRRIDPGMPVAVDVAPERGDAVDVAAAVAGDQVRALGALDQQQLFFLPGLLLGEGVPEMVPIELRVIHRHHRKRH